MIDTHVATAPVLLDFYLNSRSSRYEVTLALVEDLKRQLTPAGGICRVTDVSDCRPPGAEVEALATPTIIRRRPVPELRLVGEPDSVQDIFDRLELASNEGEQHAPGFARFQRRLARRYLRGILAGDRQAACAMLEEGLLAGASGVELMTGTIATAMVRVGVMWESGMLSVADEHQASATAFASLPTLANSLSMCWPPNSSRQSKPPLVLLATVEGEHHVLGLTMVANILMASGFDPLMLGASVPAIDLVNAIERHQPAIVAMSCSQASLLPTLSSAIATIHSNYPSLPVMLGGRACTGLCLNPLTVIAPDLDNLIALAAGALPPQPRSLLQRP